MKNQTNSIFLKSHYLINSKQGFGMIEVLIAMALLFMLSLGVTNLFSNMQKEQKRQNLIALLTTKRAQILSALQNDQSWKNTLLQATNMACLRNNTSCAAYLDTDSNLNTYEINQDRFKIFDSIGVADPTNVIIHGNIPGNNTTPIDNNPVTGLRGFTEAGLPCVGFATEPTGNPACPIGYRVSWVAASNEVGPSIQIIVKMIYNPPDSDPLKTFFNAGPLSTTFNDRYDVKISRTASTVNRAVSFGSKLPAGTAASGCGEHGYGFCDGNNYNEFEDTPGGDPFQIVDFVSHTVDLALNADSRGVTPRDIIQFNRNGRYACSITTFAFMANNVTTIFEKFDGAAWTEVGKASNFASWANAGYATNLFNVTFDVTSNPTLPSRFRLRQNCSAGGADTNMCARGFRTESYTDAAGTWRASFNCTSIVD